MDGLKTWNTLWNAGAGVTNKTQTVFATGGNRYVTNTAPDGSYTISAFANGHLSTVTRKDSGNGQIAKTTYAYDAHGRQNTATDARNGTTTYTFNNADQITTVTTPAPGNGQSAQTTATAYDTSLRAWQVTQPDNTSVTNEFFLTGLLKKTYGTRTYPVEYTYDAQGRMATMKTWQDFVGNSGTATTTWYYNQYRGWLEKKVYQGETDTTLDYEYLASGRLWKRHWERGVDTIYSYNNAGDLSGVDYTDSTTDVSYAYDRRGRQKTIVQGSATTALTYNDANEVLTETYTGGTLNGLSVTNAYDTYLRRTNLTARNGATLLTSATNTYDAVSRLATISDGTQSATYTYLANSPLVTNIVFKQSGTTRMTTIKQYDFLNRLTGISSVPSGTGVAPGSFAYAYNSANQHTRRTEADASYWVYQYDPLGQVMSGKKYWTDGTPVPGQQFEYAHDDIGNRKSTKTGGDSSGAGLRPASYAVNSVNQYTTRDVPNAFDVLGVSHATNSVTVNGSPADYRRGEYFQELVSVVNNSTSVWQMVAVTNSGGGWATGSVFVAKTPEAFTYDTDGNLTQG